MDSQRDNLIPISSQIPGQAQMRREDLVNQPSDIHNQSQGEATNLLQETGTQVKSMAQGASHMAQGAAESAVNMARGAASGAANMAHGAAEAVKNSLGMNPPHHTNDASGNINDSMPHINTSTVPGDTNYPGSLNYPTNPNTRTI